MISASPIALTSDVVHASGSIDHSFKIHPTGSFDPKEPIPTCTDEKSNFTIHPTGGKTELHHYRPSGTGIESQKEPKPTGDVSKTHKSSHAKARRLDWCSLAKNPSLLDFYCYWGCA
ncbi:hypothetical protein SBOR_4509 [Sclerotinia borealis F-4128]|uniref:Uncharacterized protein n=1 Tax=Sclerotinia borealis (strain F-4128) TaxID=1432307 RepID=W9CGL7_SCLBF|nr:hypothetical protein SBOR_4509 [Sclerotinia borealis F-4128]